MRELVRELVVALARREDEDRRDLIHAWTINALARHERLPTVSRLLSRASAQQRQTRAQQETVLHLLSDRLGIPLRMTRLIHRTRSDDGR